MSISMSSASLPVFKGMLSNLSQCLAKAEAHATAKKYDPANLLGARLVADMFPLTLQVVRSCDISKQCIELISGVEGPKFDGGETSIEQLRARIEKTVAYLDSVPLDKINGTEEKSITFPVGRDGSTRTMPGEAYLTRWVQPNFYFHVTTAYAILRSNGVDLGKADYLMGGAPK